MGKDGSARLRRGYVVVPDMEDRVSRIYNKTVSTGTCCLELQRQANPSERCHCIQARWNGQLRVSTNRVVEIALELLAVDFFTEATLFDASH